MEPEKKLIKKSIRLPKDLDEQLTEAAGKHYRSWNSELIVALENYLADWRNKH